MSPLGDGTPVDKEVIVEGLAETPEELIAPMALASTPAESVDLPSLSGTASGGGGATMSLDTAGSQQPPTKRGRGGLDLDG
eukprot:4505292-Alexandrium_andersonii.AAC.1